MFACVKCARCGVVCTGSRSSLGKIESQESHQSGLSTEVVVPIVSKVEKSVDNIDASRDSSGFQKRKNWPGLRFCESSGFRGNPRISMLQSSHKGVNTSVVSSGGFSGAAGLTILELRVQE